MNAARDPAQLFPAGTAVSHLAVYDWSGPDEFRGGSAHVHLACTEGYVVTGGTGRLQTLSRDGRLQILVVMQNAGLPEAGDSVLTLPPDYLGDPETYQAAATVEQTSPLAADAARHRRQLAVQGFLQLREKVERDGPKALEAFYAAAAALVRGRAPGWRDAWAQGPLAAALNTGEQLEELALGRYAHLRKGRLTVLSPPAERSYGMCGRLASYQVR